MPHSLKPYLDRILCGDAQVMLQKLPPGSIDCVVTSPPYWNLRDYNVRGQIGLEPSADQYLKHLCAVFDEVRRVLKPGGSCWVSLGDTYAGDSPVRQKTSDQYSAPRSHTLRRAAPQASTQARKSLALIPSRFAIEMCSRGWILRNEIIWHKPNCMPSSARDRFTVDFEKLFFFVKSRHYYFRQQFEPLLDKGRLLRPLVVPSERKKRVYGDPYIAAINPATAEASRKRMLKQGRNMRCVWRIPTRPFRGKHYAVFPETLIETPIKAGCLEGGVVLDPFMGSGTTALVAKRLGRHFIGIDLNPRYVEMGKNRLALAA